GSNKPPGWYRWSPAEKAEHLLGLSLDRMHDAWEKRAHCGIGIQIGDTQQSERHGALAHFRQAVQNKVRCLAQQNLPALPPRRVMKARPHQRQEIVAEVGSAPSASKIFTTACSRLRANSWTCARRAPHPRPPPEI